MLPGLDQDIPLVIVSNITEAFFEFPNRAADEATRTRLIYHAQCQGERSMLWLGDQGRNAILTSYVASSGLTERCLARLITFEAVMCG